MAKKALYLAGGGARGAYQAGALKAIHHILQTKTVPFDVVSGVSVGSINAAVIAECADDFAEAVDKLTIVWGEIHCQQIYRTSNYQLGKSVLKNLSTLVMKQRQTGFLLDTEALNQFLSQTINYKRLKKNITAGVLEALEVICSCYESHQTVSFYEHRNQHFEDWNYPRHSSQKAEILAEHILASSALPLFFPTVKINGFHYGDGSIGLITPLRGVIRFAVDRVLVIGTREPPIFTPPEPIDSHEIPFTQILGSMFNGLFLDNLDRDIEMVNRMNEIVLLLSLWKKRRASWRPIDILYLRPSENLAGFATAHYQSMPSLLRYLLNFLGAKHKSGELLSFLLFEKEFTRDLLKLGYQDTLARADEITSFFELP